MRTSFNYIVAYSLAASISWNVHYCHGDKETRQLYVMKQPKVISLHLNQLMISVNYDFTLSCFTIVSYLRIQLHGSSAIKTT